MHIGEQLTLVQQYGSPDKIKTLDISTAEGEVGIDHIPTEALTWFTNLETLRVSSKVESITASDLESAVILTELVVSDQLRSISRGIFPAINKLAFLSFAFNRITTIEDFAFEGLSRLFSLKLQRNRLQVIRRHTFSHLSELYVLNLNQNQINVIEQGAFDDLTKLQFLLLEENQLETLFDGIFHGLSSLIDISLNTNNISSIANALQPLKNIKKIDLSNNPLTDLDLNEFAKFSCLVDLRLANSGFSFNKTIANRNKGMPSASVLEYLYLDANNLSNAMDIRTLDNLFVDLNLADKRLKEILPQLQFLSIEGNNIDVSVLAAINNDLNTPARTINTT